MAVNVVTIPLARPDDQIGPLLEALQTSGRAGLVVHEFLEEPDRYRLLYAGDLLQARAAGVPTVGEVRGGHTVLVLDDKIAASDGLDLVFPMRTEQPYEVMLERRGVDYCLAGAAEDTVMLVTLHEDQGWALMGPVYQCNGQRMTHYFPEPRVSPGQRCPKIPSCGRNSTIEPYTG
jgi:hypothetical protein